MPPPRRRVSAMRTTPVVWVALLCGCFMVRSLLAGERELGRPILRYYTPGEHLRARENRTVVQDAAGLMWFGAGDNLLSYDGNRWGDLLLPLASAGVRQFAVTSAGTVFLGGAGVIGYLRGTGPQAEFVSLAEKLPPAHRNVEEVRSVVAVGEIVFFADDQKIMVWRQGAFTVLDFPAGPDGRGARLHRVGEQLYVTALGRGLARWQGGGLEPVSEDPILRENPIIMMEAGPTPAELILLTAERGFYQWKAGRISRLPLEANRWLEGRRVFRALRLADGSRVVAFSAVSGDGGMRFDPAGRYAGALDVSVGLVVKTLRDFFCDREGGLWIGTEQGSARLEWPSAATLFDEVNGLGHGPVTDLVRHDGALHAATSEGVYRLVPADDTGRAARFERLLGQPAHAVASHPAGLLVLGDGELVQLAGGRITPLARVRADSGRLLVSRRDPNLLWVATTRGLAAFRHSAGSWRPEGSVWDLPDGGPGLSESTDGRLWVTTSGNAVWRVAPGGTLERLGRDAGVPDALENIVIGSWGRETVLLDGGTNRLLRFVESRRRFERMEETRMPAGEPGSEVGQLGEGTAAELWLANSTGVFRFARDRSEPLRLPHFIGAAAGSAARVLAESGPAGEVLWIGGSRGLVRVEVARVDSTVIPLQAYVRAAGVGDGVELPSEHPPLTFSYYAPRQRPGSQVMYQTRVVGRDRVWSDWDRRTEQTVSNLAPGHYRFEVRARDADGVVSAPALLRFQVALPWWRTPWALLGLAVAFTGLVAGIVQLRTRALRQRAAHLEAIVAARTAELAQKNLELIRLHRLEFDEKTAARLAEEKARLEVLRYQLNPHFLFNTLASISAALPAGRTAARTMLERLADFCRLTLHRPEEGSDTTLGAEIALLRTYLEIEQARWGELLDVEVSCDPSLADTRLPQFLLLPLVENALKYGRATSIERVGVRLAAQRGPDGALILHVANTGQWVEPGAPKAVSSLGIGLDNLRQRLARHYPGAHELSFSSQDGWITVTLRLAVQPERRV